VVRSQSYTSSFTSSSGNRRLLTAFLRVQTDGNRKVPGLDCGLCARELANSFAEGC
jgi:hypothetical protein